jgi:hypothetical protein
MALRRAIVPMSCPPSVASASNSSAASACRRDHVGACLRERAAGVFLVAAQHDGHVGVAQRSGRAQGAQRTDHDHQAILHVIDARALGDGAATHEVLEGTVRFEHGIEVPDEQDTFAVPGGVMFCNHEAGAPDRRHRLPLHLETQWLEFAHDDAADALDAREIHRAAVDVDQRLEQCNRARILGCGRGDDPLLLA